MNVVQLAHEIAPDERLTYLDRRAHVRAVHGRVGGHEQQGDTRHGVMPDGEKCSIFHVFRDGQCQCGAGCQHHHYGRGELLN